MRIPFLNLSWQHEQIKTNLAARFEDILGRTAFVLGEPVDRFEKAFATYTGTKHTIGVANGTDALVIAMRALNLPAGSKVITIPTTFIASASAIVHAGLTPMFVDIDPKTRNFDIEKLRAAITPEVSAILPVHLYGQPADMDAITAIAKEHNIVVIEDACQAHGATYKGKRAGSLGKVAAFSFYPGKNLGAYGDGGAITTDDDQLAETMRMLRNHGGIAKYEHKLLGYNSRLDALQAAVLDEKLPHLDAWNALRSGIAARYEELLAGTPGIETAGTLPDSSSVHHLYVVRLTKGNRADAITYLGEHEVDAGIHYPDALHLLPVFANLGHKAGDFPVGEAFAASILSLPMFPGMTLEQAEQVATTLKAYVASVS